MTRKQLTQFWLMITFLGLLMIIWTLIGKLPYTTRGPKENVTTTTKQTTTTAASNECEINGGKCYGLSDIIADTCENHGMKTLPYKCQLITPNTKCCK